MLRSRLFMFAANLIACLLFAALALHFTPAEWPRFLRFLIADVAATVFIFLVGSAFKNSSFYDPWWSVAPPLMCALLFVLEGADTRAGLASFFVTLWGVRLTFNFLRGWQGLEHEDWRYVNLRKSSGALFFFVNLSGIHIMPTLMVFAGSYSLFGIFESERPLSLLDAVGLVVMALFIYVEARADKELHRFIEEKHPAGTILKTGLWARSRHPNYLGEVGFWWGLACVGYAASSSLWVWLGPIVVILLFLTISLPLIEKRHALRRTNYSEYKAQVPIFLPRFW